MCRLGFQQQLSVLEQRLLAAWTVAVADLEEEWAPQASHHLPALCYLLMHHLRDCPHPVCDAHTAWYRYTGCH